LVPWQKLRKLHSFLNKYESFFLATTEIVVY
jgi:hypothetical protein